MLRRLGEGRRLLCERDHAAGLEGAGRSLGQRDERLSLFDDIRGELSRVAAANVLHRVDRSSRDEQDVSGLERHRRFAVELILQDPFDDIDNLFAGMRVSWSHNSGGKPDEHLDHLAPGDAQIVPLEIGALDVSQLLRPRHVQRQSTSDQQHRYRNDSSRFHVDSAKGDGQGSCATSARPGTGMKGTAFSAIPREQREHTEIWCFSFLIWANSMGTLRLAC
jgi:hypothetical protein